jgi:hypothetical protein
MINSLDDKDIFAIWVQLGASIHEDFDECQAETGKACRFVRHENLSHKKEF